MDSEDEYASDSSTDSTSSLHRRMADKVKKAGKSAAKGALKGAKGAVKSAARGAKSAAKGIKKKFRPRPMHEDVFPNGMVHSGFHDGELIISNNDWEVDDLQPNANLDLDHQDHHEPAHCLFILERRMFMSIVWMAHVSLIVHIACMVWFTTEYNRVADYLSLAGIDYFLIKRDAVLSVIFIDAFIDVVIDVMSVIGAKSLKDCFCDYCDPPGKPHEPHGCARQTHKYLTTNSWIFDVMVLTAALMGSIMLILMFFTAFATYTAFVWKVMCNTSGNLELMFTLLGRNVDKRFDDYDATDVCIVIHKVRACLIRMTVAMAILVVFQIHFVLLAHDARTHYIHEELFNMHADAHPDDEIHKELVEEDPYLDSHNFMARTKIAEKQVLLLTHQIEAMKEMDSMLDTYDEEEGGPEQSQDNRRLSLSAEHVAHLSTEERERDTNSGAQEEKGDGDILQQSDML